MKRAMEWAVTGLVVMGLAGGCTWGREARRAEAERAARDRGQHVNVDIDVERHEERRVTTREGDRERRVERERPRGEVAAAMIAPEECPMIGDAEVSLVDLGDGAALEFVAADEGEVQIVRDRVLNIAVKHQRAMQERLSAASPHEAERGGELERHTRERSSRSAHQARADIDPMPPSHVAVVDVDRGARIIFVPVDRRDLDRLNDALDERAAYMREGSCPANLMSMQVPDDDIAG